MDQIIAANYLLSLDKCLEQLGISHFLERIGIDPDRFHDPNVYISQDEFAQVIAEAYIQSKCPYLGLLFGQSMSIVTHGFLGYAVMSSPSLGAAIQTMVDFVNTRTNLIKVALHQPPGPYFYVQIDSLIPSPKLRRFFIEMVIVHLDKMRKFLINTDVPLPKIEFDYPAPGYIKEYERIFNTEIVFGADHTKTWVLASEFDTPVSYADDASFTLARAQLQQFAEQLAHKDDLASRIKTLLMKQGLMQASMDEIASALCMTPRTLRRHLQKINLTYQDLVDEIRKEQAQTYLLNSTMSMTEISYALGFHDTSNFSKAFKRWTGFSPSEYRDRGSN